MTPFQQIFDAESWLRQHATGPTMVYLYTKEHAMALHAAGGWYLVITGAIN